MRIGLLADIHGNAHALISVLKSAKEKNIQKLDSVAERINLLLNGSKESRILVEGLDLPTNLSILDHQLYISTGQGTPGRKVWSEKGIFPIEGKILNYLITP